MVVVEDGLLLLARLLAAEEEAPAGPTMAVALPMLVPLSMAQVARPMMQVEEEML